MSVNWQILFADIMKAIPYVVAGINVVHAEKDTATKTQMAQDALSVATAAAAQLVPADNQQAAQAVSSAVGAAISATQAIHDAVNGVAPTPPAPAPAG